MRAGFAEKVITPPVGCVMEGFNRKQPAASVHDDLFARAVWLEDHQRAALVVTADLLFMERPEMARLKQALRDAVGLEEADILVNFSHTHSGPRMTRWHYSGEPDPAYIDQLIQAIVAAAETARSQLTEVTIHAGEGRTTLPISRRRPTPDGRVEWGPAPLAPSCDRLPVCLLRDTSERVVAGFFSVACHPTINHANVISAEYPGVAVAELNRRFATQGFVFLQGGGGDTKPRTIATHDGVFRDGTWEDVQAAGLQVADEVEHTVRCNLQPAQPALGAVLVEMELELDSPEPREALAALAADATTDRYTRAWADDMLARLAVGSLPSRAGVSLHGLRLAADVVLVGVEAELGSELALLISASSAARVTFALGYTNGVRLNLPCDRQLAEGGYGVDTAWEFRWPAKLAPGIDATVRASIEALQRRL